MLKIKFSRIIENPLLIWCFWIICILILINTFLKQTFGVGIGVLVEPFKGDNSLYNFIKHKEGTLTTISAIFIGIYFTIYTILGTVRLESSFALIDKESFDKLRAFLKTAFVSSFSFLFIVLFLPIFNFNMPIPYIYQAIFLALILMLLTAFRLSFVLYHIFEHDFSTMHSKLTIEEDERRKNNEILFRLSDFLDDYQHNQDKEQADFMRKLIEEQESKKKSN
jgi:hypothetical protein